MADSVREDLIEIMLAHFKPSPHGGSWRLSPGDAADDIIAKYNVGAPQPKKHCCEDGHNYVVSKPDPGMWGTTFLYCTKCGGVPTARTSTTTTFKD